MGRTLSLDYWLLHLSFRSTSACYWDPEVTLAIHGDLLLQCSVSGEYSPLFSSNHGERFCTIFHPINALVIHFCLCTIFTPINAPYSRMRFTSQCVSSVWLFMRGSDRSQNSGRVEYGIGVCCTSACCDDCRAELRIQVVCFIQADLSFQHTMSTSIRALCVLQEAKHGHLETSLTNHDRQDLQQRYCLKPQSSGSRWFGVGIWFGVDIDAWGEVQVPGVSISPN